MASVVSFYGYDQRAEVLSTTGMVATDNVYPNIPKIYKGSFTVNADMPFDFFLSRYTEGDVSEKNVFCESLVNDSHVLYTGQDGSAALIMALAADKSTEENRWITSKEIVESVYCSYPVDCDTLPVVLSPQGMQAAPNAKVLLIDNVDT